MSIRRGSHHHRPPASGNPRRERGVALLELAFVSMFLVAIVAGTFDYGLGWRSGLTITEAVRTGARVGSGQSTSRGADYYALTGVQASLMASGKIDDVVQVVIFKATSASGTVPANCATTPPTSGSSCNILTGAQLKALTAASFDLVISADPAVAPTGSGCLKSGSYTVQNNWCPNVRVNDPLDSADYYGIWIKYRHRNLFPINGAYRDISRTAVMRLEPEVN